MGFEYRIKDQHAIHFVTFTVHQWVDIFTRELYKELFVKNLQYCQQAKGLQIFAWVLMTNHAHLIIRTPELMLSDVIRDFKKHTAKKIFEAMIENPTESRRNWLRWLLTKDENIWFWEEGYHGEEVNSKPFFLSKQQYIHQNPVRAGYVANEADYLYSSAYYSPGVKPMLELEEF